MLLIEVIVILSLLLVAGGTGIICSIAKRPLITSKLALDAIALAPLTMIDRGEEAWQQGTDDMTQPHEIQLANGHVSITYTLTKYNNYGAETLDIQTSIAKGGISVIFLGERILGYSVNAMECEPLHEILKKVREAVASGRTYRTHERW